ncbi:MAG: rRNA maturation RNase YbeY [Clostridia bacterium]|nr:rRNA maturation RNase YbeY [Clostridia bacterium]
MRHYCTDKHRLYIDFGADEGTEVSYEMKIVARYAVLQTLAYEGIDRDVCLSLTFCDNAEIQALNLEHRGKDAPTDVLSFPQYETRDAVLEAGDTPVLLGDIVISLERAAVQAEEVGNTLLREVAFLCIHSTLHLLGYDHERSGEDEEDMCRRQREIVGRLEEL